VVDAELIGMLPQQIFMVFANGIVVGVGIELWQFDGDIDRGAG
jgi:hypothetical protein